MKCASAILSCGLPRSTIFFHVNLSQNCKIVGEKFIEHKMCVSLQLLSGIFFILRGAERDVIENVYWCSCKVLFILVQFQ